MPNSGSGEDGQLAYKKKYAHQRHYKAFARFRRTMDKINDINTAKEEQQLLTPYIHTYIINCKYH